MIKFFFVIYLIERKRRLFVPTFNFHHSPIIHEKRALLIVWKWADLGLNEIYLDYLAQIPSSIPFIFFFSDFYSVLNAIIVQPYTPIFLYCLKTFISNYFQMERFSLGTMIPHVIAASWKGLFFTRFWFLSKYDMFCQFELDYAIMRLSSISCFYHKAQKNIKMIFLSVKCNFLYLSTMERWKCGK